MHRLLFLLTMTAMPLCSHAIEEPKFEVIRRIDTVELRQYAPYDVAEVALDATAEDAGGRAFPILACCIFRKTKGVRLESAPEPLDPRVLLRLATQGQPVLARYNGPVTTWFMRRNEMRLALR